MSYSQESNLEKEIVEKLTNLTDRGELSWQKNDQEFTSTHRGLSFKIEDSGQDWLYITRLDTGVTEIIQDIASFSYVSELLDSIKLQLIDRLSNGKRGHPPVSYDTRPKNLEDILSFIS
jgi:hypothetical protein